MNKKYLILLGIGIIFLLKGFVYAQIFNNPRENYIFEELERLERRINYLEEKVKDKEVANQRIQESSRKEVIEKALRDISIELAFEYAFSLEGEQTFKLVLEGGSGSRLNYPFEGNLFIFKSEIGYLSKIFLGTRYAISRLKRTVCTDEDWSIFNPGDYLITYQDCKTKLEFF
ncbi:MAG: hypothetical protein N2Z79_03675, partial [Candidatus Omnitrophica bacterium]|nr:hypothetical protein [Candidatus Omnitrophota bacterium]